MITSSSTTTVRSSDRLGPKPHSYQTVVIFRNDDLEPGHEDELRRTIDEMFIEETVPVTNAVIPVPSADEPITHDEGFCEELRERRRNHPDIFEYSLHGYSHTATTEEFYGDGGFAFGQPTEFGALPYREQRDRIEDGEQILDECLGSTSRSFVPPYGTYDDVTGQALADEGITVVSSSGWFTEEYFGETDPFETDGVLHVPADTDFVSDWKTLEFHDQHYLRDEFETAYENGDLYVQTLHYWTFTSDDRIEMLRSFLRYVTNHEGVLLMTVAAFADAYRTDRLVRTADGWRYVPNETDVAVHSTGADGRGSASSERNSSVVSSILACGRRLLGR